MEKHLNKFNTKYIVKVKSKVHPEIYHCIQIDLHCHEKMPKEKHEKNTKLIDLQKELKCQKNKTL